MVKAFRETQSDTRRIIFVPGNGEYADQELGESRRQYREAVESVPNTVFLDDDVIVLPTGVRVIGSTLWSLVADGEIDHYTKLLADHGLNGRSSSNSCAICPGPSVTRRSYAPTSGLPCGHGQAGTTRNRNGVR
jgi:hypothetical protein